MAGLTSFQKKQYERIKEHLKDDKSANLQLVVIAAMANWDEGVQDQSKLFPPPAPDQAMGVLAAMCLQYPLSRGTVHIKSSDPTEHPALDPGFMSHPADATVLAAGLKMLDKASKTEHLADKLSEYHPIGSCAMGDCVDTHLRVNGTRNLRVADASIFPNHVSGNIVSSVYAVAEKAADIIKADWDYAALAKAA